MEEAEGRKKKKRKEQRNELAQESQESRRCIELQTPGSSYPNNLSVVCAILAPFSELVLCGELLMPQWARRGHSSSYLFPVNSANSSLAVLAEFPRVALLGALGWRHVVGVRQDCRTAGPWRKVTAPRERDGQGVRLG